MSRFMMPELQQVDICVSGAPTYNALVGMAALGTSNQHFGFEQRTAIDLTAEEYTLNRVIFDLLDAGLFPANADQEFGEYLAALEALPAETLARRALPHPPDRDTLIAYLVSRGQIPPEAARLARALLLLENPPLLKTTILEHLCSFWTRFLADEWRKKSSLINYIVHGLEERGLPQGDAPTVLRILLGRDLPPAIAADLSSVRTIMLVPAAFVEFSAIRPDDPATLWVFVKVSELTSWALRQEPPNPGEMLSRINPLADRARLRIIELLAHHGELSAQQLIAALELSQSVVSRHLAHLNGYVIERRGEGANKLYRLDPRYVEWTLALLRHFALPPRATPPVRLTPAAVSYPPELRRFMNRDGRLTRFPTREYDRHLVLRHIAKRFAAERIYTEREVNDVISSAIAYDDFVTIRRSLFNSGYIGREKDGSRYWLIDPAPATVESTI